MRALRLLFPLIVAAALITGCGGKPATSTPPAPTTAAEAFAGKSANEIATSAIAALKAAPSVRMKGTVNNNGQKMTIDLKYNRAKDGEGTISADGQTMQLMKIGEDHYLKADDELVATIVGDDKNVATLVKGKWLKGTSSDLGMVVGLLFGLADQVLNDPPTGLSRGATGVINGVKALALTGEVADGFDKVWVATEGEPYPLRLDAGADGAVDFTEYGATLNLTAPPASEVVDLSKLGS